MCPRGSKAKAKAYTDINIIILITELLKNGSEAFTNKLLKKNSPNNNNGTTTTTTEHFRIELKWYHGIFVFSCISLLFCLLQIFLPPPFGLMQSSEEVAMQPFSDGCADGMQQCVCPRETICADTMLSMILLALARSSVFFDYPLYMMMFLSKAHNLNDGLRRTPLREFIEFADMHRIHYIFGIVVGIETMFHSLFHLVRWGLRGDDIQLLWQTKTGITGLIACFITPFIVWPMALPLLKKRMSFELRKGLHFLVWVWALALVYHAPDRIYWLIGIPSGVYAADRVYGFFIRTNLIELVLFERYGERGVVVEFENPPGYDCSKTSYVYVMLPWISKLQWHAFTIFQHPNKPNTSTLCMGIAGDWTKKLHDTMHAPTLKPIYLRGPFQSEFSDCAIDTTHAIAVASGIGITPTLSLIQAYVGQKRINVIWTCRDPGLIEHFLHKVDLSPIFQFSFALIFYTGKRKLVLPSKLPTNFFIFTTRPNLERTIAGIVTSIESGEGLPEEMYETQKQLAEMPFSTRVKLALGRVATMYTPDEMFDYAVQKTRDNQHRRVATTYTPDEEELISLKDHQHGEEIGTISCKGLEEMFQLFLEVDTDGSGAIDRDEFDALLDLAADYETTDSAKETSTRSLGVSFLARSTSDTNLSNKHDDAINAAERGLARNLSNKSLTSCNTSLASITEATVDPRQSFSRSKSVKSKRNIMAKDANDQLDEIFAGEAAVEYVKELSSTPDQKLKEWSIFYCGASAAIEADLKRIKTTYGIGNLAVEKFDW